MYCNEISDDVTPVKTALLLAAGTGSRLSPLTDSTPKCLVEVDGTPILERLICALSSYGFKRLVVVVGHLSEVIQDYLGSHYAGIEITYIVSPLYKTTNNIYSLWLAGKVIDEPFLLIESDLVFQPALLQPMLRPDRIAISKQLPWMNGTTATLDERQQLDAFCLGTEGNNEARHFKTVNIYSFSRTTWQLIWQRLDRHIAADNVQSYYETVFAELVAEGDLSFTPVIFDADRWYEIDTLEDLRAAEKLLPTPATIKAVSLRTQNGDDIKKYADLSDVIRPLSTVITTN
ncbi:MAG: phosphocholine cytidylyltransferase family protein [Desulfuromonas sp.]|nr:phosphocholine cytidylyltransferase family protein [Desulfuromonas sp.]